MLKGMARLATIWALTAILSLSSFANAERMLKASSLVTCMDNSQFSASNFDVTFTPENRSIAYDVKANIELSGYVTAEVSVVAYGFTVITETVNPCKLNLNQLCPLNPGQFDVQAHSELGEDLVKKIPGVAYTVPDIDAIVYVKAHDTNGKMVACIQVDLTNGKSVDQVAVKWVTAIIAGIGLVTSAIISTWGNSYTAAHIATNALSLFGYFQSVVIVTMEAVDRVPPMASSWAQNLAWSMGLIEVNFMQKIFRWYVQATGGNPTTYIKYPTISVLIQKRHEIIPQIHGRVRDFIEFHGRGFSDLVTRAEDYAAKSSNTLLVLRGIKRVGYQAGIEETSIVLTGFTFFVLICLVMGLFFVIVKGVVTLLARSNVGTERFAYYRANWRAMFKGATLRMVYIGFPQLLILSLWEFIQRDSAAVIVLAVFFFLIPIGILGWNAFKVFVIGQRSMASYKTPAYLLYSDSQVMNKYGFLYIQFEASKYFFIVPGLVYIFVKGCFISFAQSSGKTQGLAIFLIEAAYLALVSWKRPYMDKATNVINIAMSAINTLNAFFFLFFSNLFGQPMSVASIMGVLFFIINAAFSLILLIFTLVTCGMVIFSKHPDSRYKPAKDDRASFIQEQYQGPGATDEFTALGDAAKADHEESSASDGRLAYPHYNNNSSGSLDQTGTNEKHLSYGSASTPRSTSGSDSLNTPMMMQTEHSRHDSSTGLRDSPNENSTNHDEKRGSHHWPL